MATPAESVRPSLSMVMRSRVRIRMSILVMINREAVMPFFFLHENVSLWCKRIGVASQELGVHNYFRIESIMFKRLSLVVLLLLQFQCITARSQNAATQQSEHRKTVRHTLVIFPSSIPLEGTKGCKSIALWTF
jgi:hypothetical protein